jgi:BirA family biotin operon repressor/biotin-[acetyl-CoA-carboxylase] ligase
VIEAGAPVLTFGALDSTNEEAKRRAQGGQYGPCWLMAHQQTAGRGRRGRTWESAEGALFATYLGHTSASPSCLALLGFAAAVAVAECLDSVGATGARLKWPNDVFLHGGKVAGVLLESSARPGGGLWFALGIGVNAGAAPIGLDRPVSGAGSALAPLAMLDRIADRLAPLAAPLPLGDFTKVREAWLSRAAGLGEPVHTQLNGETISGTFADLEADGALALDTAHGRVRITAGEVFFHDQT